jgi:Fe-S cluster assembly protein SufD
MDTPATKKLDRFIHSLRKTTIPFPLDQIDQANQLLVRDDFPNTRDEAWKYTRLAKIAALEPKQDYEKLSVLDLSSFVLDHSHPTIIMVNGVISQIKPSKEDIEGLMIRRLSDCSQNELNALYSSGACVDVFDALNTVYLNDGLWITAAQNTVIRRPITIVHVSTGEQAIYHSRIRIDLGKHSQLEVIQHFVSHNALKCFGNIATEIQLKEGASLAFHKIQCGLKENFLLSRERAYQAANSKLTIHTHTADSFFVRNDTTIRVNGINAESNLFGTYLLKGEEHVDNHTCIDHIAPHCLSNELYKGVIGEKATGVFNGKVFVRKDAQKINAFQSNANVLTSKTATINSKPELEIYADDVKCSHGSTTGQLDDEAIFYLRARGLSEKAAKDLLIQAFLEDVISKTDNETVQKLLESAVHCYFEKSEQG